MRKSPPTQPHRCSDFSDRFETDAAGLSEDSDVPLSKEQLDWATHLVVMEKSQIARLRRKFGKHVSGKRIICLDIKDRYNFMQPELIELLEQRVTRLK